MTTAAATIVFGMHQKRRGRTGSGGQQQQQQHRLLLLYDNYYLAVGIYVLIFVIGILLCVTCFLHGRIIKQTNTSSTPWIAINESSIRHTNNNNNKNNANNKGINAIHNDELLLRNSILQRLKENSEYNEQIFQDREYIDAHNRDSIEAIDFQ